METYSQSHLSLTKGILFSFLLLFNLVLFAQDGNRIACGAEPMEDVYLQDPFYGNSEYFISITGETQTTTKRLIIKK